jgi:hypothetical protein
MPKRALASSPTPPCAVWRGRCSTRQTTAALRLVDLRTADDHRDGRHGARPGVRAARRRTGNHRSRATASAMLLRLRIEPRPDARSTTPIETPTLSLGFQFPGQLRNLRWEAHPRREPRAGSDRSRCAGDRAQLPRRHVCAGPALRRGDRERLCRTDSRFRVCRHRQPRRQRRQRLQPRRSGGRLRTFELRQPCAHPGRGDRAYPAGISCRSRGDHSEYLLHRLLRPAPSGAPATRRKGPDPRRGGRRRDCRHPGRQMAGCRDLRHRRLGRKARFPAPARRRSHLRLAFALLCRPDPRADRRPRA